MTHAESGVKIFVTNDYSKFNMIIGNRKINHEKIKRIIKEITSGNDMLRYYPIQCSERNDNLFIIDGQHRFQICKNLHVPVHYIIVTEKKSLPDIAKVNTNVEKWKLVDFINCYIEQGNNHYVKLQEFIKQYGLSISVSIKMLYYGNPGVEGHDEEIIKKFQYGLFEVKEYEKAKTLSDILMRFSFFSNKMERSFAIAIYRIIEAGIVPIEDVIEAVKRRPDMLIQQSNYKNYIYKLEEIMNVGKQHRIVLSAPVVKKSKKEKETKANSPQKMGGGISGSGILKKQEPKKYATRQPDSSGKIAVKIDSKTTVYANPGDDIEKLKKKYQKK
jgi:hypothetical protein